MDADVQAALDAYGKVWDALETPPASFSVGFADRVLTAVETERRAAPVARLHLVAPLTGMGAAVLLLLFQVPLARALTGVAPVEALPWVAFALLFLSLTEGFDRAIRRPI